MESAALSAEASDEVLAPTDSAINISDLRQKSNALQRQKEIRPVQAAHQ